MKNYIIIPKFTAGVGNQLFVYFYGKILAEKNNLDFFHPDLLEIKKLNIKSNLHLIKDKRQKEIELNFITLELEKNKNYVLKYFNKLENYNIYKPHLRYIRSFYTNNKKNNEDLVIHLRAGNDWVNKNLFLGVPEPSEFKNIIDKLSFKKLYIVTNTTLQKKFKKWTNEDYINLKKNLKINGGDGEPKETFKQGPVDDCPCWVDKKDHQKALNKINQILDVLNAYNPIWISNNISDDFEFITNFNTIICSPSTFSWWAAVLSKSENVYMYKHWKNKHYISINRKDKCKNLGITDYEGWKKWPLD